MRCPHCQGSGWKARGEIIKGARFTSNYTECHCISLDEGGFYGENNPPVGQGEKPRQTEAQAAQVAYCKQLLMEGQDEAFLIALGYAAGAIKQAKEQTNDPHTTSR